MNGTPTPTPKGDFDNDNAFSNPSHVYAMQSACLDQSKVIILRVISPSRLSHRDCIGLGLETGFFIQLFHNKLALGWGLMLMLIMTKVLCYYNGGGVGSGFQFERVGYVNTHTTIQREMWVFASNSGKSIMSK